MPEERIYRSDRLPSAAPARPLPSAESFGAGVGRAVEQAGTALHRASLGEYRRERQELGAEEAAAASHEFAKHRQEMDEFVREQRANAAAGGEGHLDAIVARDAAAREALLEGIAEDATRNRMAQMWDNYTTTLARSEGQWQETQRVGKMRSDVGNGTDIQANRIRNLPEDVDAYALEIRLGYESIDALPGVPDDVKDQLKREQVDQKFAIAKLNGLNDSNPAVALALIEAGAFDEVLTPQQMEQARSGAQVEMRRAQAVGAQEASMAKSMLLEQAATVEARSANGLDVAEEAAALIPQLEAIGDTSRAEKLRGILGDSQFARVWGGVAPMAREQRLAALANKENLTELEERELAWQQGPGRGLTSQANADPVGYAMANMSPGMAPPPLDISDPESVAARAAWASSAQMEYGRPIAPLSSQEALQLRENYESGEAGAVAVMEALSRFPDGQAMRAARMVDPSDDQLPVMVVLPQQYRNLALSGRDALRGNSQLLAVDDLDDEDLILEQRERFENATRGIDFALRNAIFATAEQIEAGLIARNSGERTPRLQWLALNMALGARGTGAERKGGLARWREHWFLLPDGVSANDFGALAQRAAAGEDGPLNLDGSPARIRFARPVFVAPGVYEFAAPNGKTLQDKDGAAWRFRVGEQ